MIRKNKQYDVFRDLYGKEVKAQIKKTLDEYGPLTVQAVAARIESSYQTAKRRLREMVADHEIISHSIDKKTKVFFVNPDYEPPSKVKE